MSLPVPQQFPKRCGCGRSYSAETWRGLECTGLLVDDWESQEMRNCICGSTITVIVKVFKVEDLTGEAA